MMQTFVTPALPLQHLSPVSMLGPADPLARGAATRTSAAPQANFTAPLHAIAQSLLPGDVVFDIGANTGDKAAALLSRGVRVICIEPQPACVAALNNRFRANPNITIVPNRLLKNYSGGPQPMNVGADRKLSHF
jgi:hypothetical protein